MSFSLLLVLVNFSFGQSAYFFKTTEALELEKWDAVESSNSTVSNAIAEELNSRAKANEEIVQLEAKLNEKLKVEDYFGAETIQNQIEMLKAVVVESSELRKKIELSVGKEDYETAAQYKSSLLNLHKPESTAQINASTTSVSSGTSNNPTPIGNAGPKTVQDAFVSTNKSNNSKSEPPKEDNHEINIFNLSTTEQVEGFYPPKKGNSVVYIARWAIGGYAAGFEYFHEDQFIGKFVGNGYLRFECKPGKHLFWASSENKEFITTELEPNRTYIIRAMAAPGAWKMHASLKPITRSDEEDFTIIKNMVNRKPASHLEESKLRKLNNQLKNFIQKELNHYQNVTKDKYNFRHLSADSFIPTELLNQ